MKQGIYKIAVGTPKIKLCDPEHNAKEIMRLIGEAESAGVKVLVLPELCVTGATAGDLYLLDSMVGGAEVALDEIADYTEGKDILAVVGAPIMHEGKLYNSAVYISHGRVIGVVPSAHGSGVFASYEGANGRMENLDCPIGAKLIFKQKGGELTIASEVGGDVYAPDNPSASHALAGALLLCAPSSLAESAGKSDYRRNLLSATSARLKVAYAYAEAGRGETTTDEVYAGHNIIAENGVVLTESELYSDGLVIADIDIKHLIHDRAQYAVYGKNKGEYETVEFSLITEETPLSRKPNTNPFLPADSKNSEYAESILRAQTAGLVGRMRNCNLKKCVIGISGGLDSTLALLVVARAYKELGLPMTALTTVTMPCFGTTARTKSNAQKTCEILGTDFRTVDIGESVKRHLLDIGHDGVTTDVTYENAQARERTQVLFDIGNAVGGIVIGTGDLSEIALGWCTYNGDHMSSYSVNASVPKTLVRYLVAYEAERLPKLRDVLLDVIDTPVSPELLPAEEGKMVQPTEEIVGPYELHDFFLYHFIRWGSSQSKIKRLALSAFEGVYPYGVIDKWLGVFFRRFYSSAFKRSCMPDGPKVTDVSLSPRGAWKMPSDVIFPTQTQSE